MLPVLARYQIVRGKRDPSHPLPEGRRMDTRSHTQHVLRPERAWVEALIADPSAASFQRFARAYRAALDQRWAHDPAPFDALARLALSEDVYLGCSCPTRWNTDVLRCHTVIALRFMAERYPQVDVVFP